VYISSIKIIIYSIAERGYERFLLSSTLFYSPPFTLSALSSWPTDLGICVGMEECKTDKRKKNKNKCVGGKNRGLKNTGILQEWVFRT
jgi:hypothetical protein